MDKNYLGRKLIFSPKEKHIFFSAQRHKVLSVIYENNAEGKNYGKFLPILLK